MNNLSQYIFEKLKIDKDTKGNSIDEPIEKILTLSRFKEFASEKDIEELTNSLIPYVDDPDFDLDCYIRNGYIFGNKSWKEYCEYIEINPDAWDDADNILRHKGSRRIIPERIYTKKFDEMEYIFFVNDRVICVDINPSDMASFKMMFVISEEIYEKLKLDKDSNINFGVDFDRAKNFIKDYINNIKIYKDINFNIYPLENRYNHSLEKIFLEFSDIKFNPSNLKRDAEEIKKQLIRRRIPIKKYSLHEDGIIFYMEDEKTK